MLERAPRGLSFISAPLQTLAEKNVGSCPWRETAVFFTGEAGAWATSATAPPKLGCLPAEPHSSSPVGLVGSTQLGQSFGSLFFLLARPEPRAWQGMWRLSQLLVWQAADSYSRAILK